MATRITGASTGSSLRSRRLVDWSPRLHIDELPLYHLRLLAMEWGAQRAFDGEDRGVGGRPRRLSVLRPGRSEIAVREASQDRNRQRIGEGWTNVDPVPGPPAAAKNPSGTKQ